MAITLKIQIEEANCTKSMKFDPRMFVEDATKVVWEKLGDIPYLRKEDGFGLLLASTEEDRAFWMEPSKTLEYYMVKDGDTLKFRSKMRKLRVRTMENHEKVIQVDDTQPVANLMVVICSQMGIKGVHDEYSLVREKELEENENKPPPSYNFGTLTLRKRRDKDGDIIDPKMEQLKRKLKTDDEVPWVDHSKTLDEQGIGKDETLLLRRKFFVSDKNIDANDPVQLGLLYAQCKKTILDGTHPVTQALAVQLAGYQCQVEMGEWNPKQHENKSYDTCLPREFMKMKGMGKRISDAHREHKDMDQRTAQRHYVSCCRSLPTYGVTFFLVKEKMPKKQKLVPRLLGITKDSILRLDAKTKEIIKTYPLTKVKRWGNTSKTFTLDFGDYQDQYYSVQTNEGEHISQLISGYIDIILKKKQSKDYLGVDGDEGSTVLEDTVSPSRATYFHPQTIEQGTKFSLESIAKPAVLRGPNAEHPYGTGHVDLGSPKPLDVTGDSRLGYGPPLSDRKPYVENGFDEERMVSHRLQIQEMMRRAENELDASVDVPDLGTDAASKKYRMMTLNTHKQNISSQLAAMNAATAQVVTLSGVEEVDNTALAAAVSTITSNVPQMAREVKRMVTLMEDPRKGEDLIAATRQLCNAFSDLLSAAEPEQREHQQSLLTAASRVGEATHNLLASIEEEDVVDKEVQDILLGLAKAVATATAALVLKAKNVASQADDPELSNRIINAATHCALSTSQLVASAKAVAPTIHSPACQEQLIQAAQGSARGVEGVVAACQDFDKDERLIADLGGAANDVSRALNELLNYVKYGCRERAKQTLQEQSVDTIMAVSDKILRSDDSKDMVKQARVLAEATAQLIKAIKGEAEQQSDSDLQKRLLAAAKVLADATTKMVEAAKACASSPEDPEQRTALRQAAENLRNATSAAASNALKKKMIKRLENAAKHAASATTQTINAAQSAGNYNTNAASQTILMEECRETASHIPRLIQSVRESSSQAENASAQLTLIDASQHFLPSAEKMMSATKAVLPTIDDQASHLQLQNNARQMSSALNDLRSAVTRAMEACGGSLELDAALDILRAIDQELIEVEQAAYRGNLKPLPGETQETAAAAMNSASKSASASITQMLSAISQGDEHYTGQAARETAGAMRDFADSVRGVAATTTEKDVHKKVFVEAHQVLRSSIAMIEEAKRAINEGPSGPAHGTLNRAARNVTSSLTRTVNALPGLKGLDEIIQRVDSQFSETVHITKFPSSPKSYAELQAELADAAASLNDASSEVVDRAPYPSQLLIAAKTLQADHDRLARVGLELAGAGAGETQSKVVAALKTVSRHCSKLLIAAKTTASDPNAPNVKGNLAAAARAVTDAINSLLDTCSSSAPGQQSCENAVRNIQSMRHLLDHPTEPINDMNYFGCLDAIMGRSKSLGDSMTGIANHAKQGNIPAFDNSVGHMSDAICGLIEAAAQSAYLVGVSDPSSVKGTKGIVDLHAVQRAAEAIRTACDTLRSSDTATKDQALAAATTIAKHTSTLCSLSRTASNQTKNPVAKTHFVEAAKTVASATTELVQDIKALESNFTESNRRRCAESTLPLLEAVDNLCAYASSAEFASVPAKVTQKARAAQEPITSAGRNIISSSCAMISAAKQLAVCPKDPPTWQAMATYSKSVSDSIKSLAASVRDRAPGQSECDAAIDAISAAVQELDQASIAAISQNLTPRRDNTIKGFNDIMKEASLEILRSVEGVRQSAKFEAEKLGHNITMFANYFQPLANASIGSASNMAPTSKQQTGMLDQTKTVAVYARQLIYAAKEAGGNPKATQVHADIDESCDSVKDAVQDLLQTLEQASTEAGIVTGLVEMLKTSMNKVDKEAGAVEVGSGPGSFVDHQTRMVNAAKEIAKTAQDMVSKSTAHPHELGSLGGRLSHFYMQLADETRGAVASTTSVEVANCIRRTVHDLGGSCVDLVRAGGAVQMAPADSFAQRDIADAAKQVSEKVSNVLAALQAGSRGTQACINAAMTVQGIIGDLDTTIMFATAGTLNPERDDDVFAEHREGILKTAKALVEDTKTLVTGAASSQEQLAVAAQNAVQTISQLVEVVKLGAASLGSHNPEAQVMLINAVKDVASALGDLIQSTKTAAGKHINDPAMVALKDSAKVMVTNVTSLLKTVKAVEDEHSRGTRALESTIEAIAQEIRAFDTMEIPVKQATPEELIRSTKPITLSTAKAVAAGNSCHQDDVIQAANMGRKAICDMLAACKGATLSAEDQHAKKKALSSGRECAVKYRALLEVVLGILQRPTHEAKRDLPGISRGIAQCVTEIVSAAEALKGSDWVDPNDPTVIAENELLGAAASIDAAARKLAQLRPRKGPKEADETMNFDQMILEAAKSIAAATSALVKAASSAQRELIEQGKMSRHPQYASEDGQWSEGLVSAARMVAAATHSLCEAANALVQGHSTEEKLIAAAKQVAASTAQLLVACKVKADPTSRSMQKLQDAGNAVKKATDNLVRAAQQAIDQEEERQMTINTKMVGGIAQEINARSEMLRLEKELDDARRTLATIRKAKYRGAPGEDGSYSDWDGYDSSQEMASAAFGQSSSIYNQSGSLNLSAAMSPSVGAGPGTPSFTSHAPTQATGPSPPPPPPPPPKRTSSALSTPRSPTGFSSSGPTPFAPSQEEGVVTASTPTSVAAATRLLQMSVTGQPSPIPHEDVTYSTVTGPGYMTSSTSYSYSTQPQTPTSASPSVLGSRPTFNASPRPFGRPSPANGGVFRSNGAAVQLVAPPSPTLERKMSGSGIETPHLSVTKNISKFEQTATSSDEDLSRSARIERTVKTTTKMSKSSWSSAVQR